MPPGLPAPQLADQHAGDVSLIDFEHARINLPARDFVRLRFRIWAARPDLRDAFLDGYGRPLTKPKTNSSGTWARSTP